MIKDIPENLKKLLSFYNMNSDFFSNIKMVNLNIKKESTLNELGYCVPDISKSDFSAALKKGNVTLPVSYGSVKNEIYDLEGNFVCCLDEI